MVKRNVIFVRHKFDEPEGPEVVKRLWENKQIAVRFQNIPSIDPDDYEEKFKKDAISRLRKYCEAGVIVAASYRESEPSESKLLIGTIGPGDPEKLIVPEKINGYFYKVVSIEGARDIPYNDYPLLKIQPIRSTISRWHIAEKLVKTIYAGKPLEWSVKSLAPGQLEVLCYEYLRMKGEIAALILPIGRSLPDIDIYGLQDSGEPIVAQVTHSSNRKKIETKRDGLKEFGADEEQIQLIFFGPESAYFEDERIRFIAIEEVFSKVTQSDNDVYLQMVKHMLGGRERPPS